MELQHDQSGVEEVYQLIHEKVAQIPKEPNQWRQVMKKEFAETFNALGKFPPQRAIDHLITMASGAAPVSIGLHRYPDPRKRKSSSCSETYYKQGSFSALLATARVQFYSCVTRMEGGNSVWIMRVYHHQ